MCLAEVLSMQGFGSFAALLPELRGQWGLSYASAGWVEGAFPAWTAAIPLTSPGQAGQITPLSE